MMRAFIQLLCCCALVGHATCSVFAATAGGDVGLCSRTEPCLNYGNCQLHTGICACPPGYGGRRCEKALLSACALTRSPLEGRPAALLCSRTWGSMGVRSCDCLRQCVAHMPPDMAHHGACFERAGGVDMQTSDFPEANEEGVVYRRSSSPAAVNNTMTREEYLLLQATVQRLKSAPLHECKDSCNFEGRCMHETEGNKRLICLCNKGFFGDACMQPDPSTCYNNCSSEGTCIRGFCSCTMGYFGIDCSINLDAASNALKRSDPMAELDMPTGDPELEGLLANSTAGSAIANPRAVEVPTGTTQELRRPLVYVYELPPWLAQSYELEFTGRGHGIYNAFNVLFPTLLADKAVRTLDPWEANLFYVPAFTYSVASNLGRPHDHVRRVLRFIRAQYPALWARHGGRDHIVWAPGDRGICPLPPDLEGLIWLVHYGAEHTYPGGHALHLKPDVDPFNSSQTGSCFKPNRGIVIAPQFSNLPREARKTYGPDAVPQPLRKTLLVFAGDVRPTDPSYSQGVRQWLAARYGNATVPDVIFARGLPDMVQSMRESKFCLAPSGHGWGSRLSCAMVAGCVPVIIQDGVHQPYDDVIPYDTFSLRVPQAELENLEARLRAVTPSQLRVLQHGVERYHSAFVWRENGQPEPLSSRDAYFWFVKSLQRRLQTTMAGFHRH